MAENKNLTGYPSVDRPWAQFYSNIEKSNIFLNTTPYQGLVKNNRQYPQDIAIEYFGSQISFAQLFRHVDDTAKALKEYGVERGDFVTICATTTPEVIYLFYAISKIGAIANVISPFYTPEELLGRIDECESSIIVIVDQFLPKFKDILEQEKNKSSIILPIMNSSFLRFLPPYNNKYSSNQVTWNQFEKCGLCRDEVPIDEYEPLKPQAMVYSSGTTGASKGILLSVDCFQKLINAYGNSGFDTSRRQTVYQNIPPWHSTGLSLGINFPLSYGVKVCIDPRFDHDVFIKNVLKFRPEYILTNTSMYQGFTYKKTLRKLKHKSLSFLKYPVEGGEPLTEKDIMNIETVFRDHGSSARLLNGYGECECGATVTTDITGHKFSNSASGIPLPDITTIGIFDDDFKELGYGRRGNILVKTEIGMLEYYKNPEATAEFFYTDKEGNRWSKTGDIGYINEDGSLVVLGRKSDYSVISGKVIFNFDIENAILSSDKVKLCEVQTHPDNDEQLIAHIVWSDEAVSLIEQNADVQHDLLIGLQKKVLSELRLEQAIPHYFCIREKFPSAHSGKRDIQFIKQDIAGLIEIPSL